MTTRVDFRLRADNSAPGEARHSLDGLAGELPPRVLDNLRLLVSELVTNSVRHAGTGPGGHVELLVDTTEAHVRVEVRDRGPGFAHEAVQPSIYQVGGWGLYLVEQLADRWGVIKRGGTCVWFEIDVALEEPRSRSA